MKAFRVMKAFRLKATLFCFLALWAASTYAQQGTTYFLLRHAEKVDNSRDPDLSLPGKARAQRLAELLQQMEIDAIYSTDYKRTQQTVAPLAREQEVTVTSYRPFDEEMIKELQTAYPGVKVVVVGHSNTIPDLVNRLIGERIYEQLDDSDYSKLFVVTTYAGDATHHILTY